jgi:hypothetical protein
MRSNIACLLLTLVFSGHRDAAARTNYSFDQGQFVGNVVGRVVDSANGRGLAGTTVILIDKAWSSELAKNWANGLRNLLLASSVRHATTNSRGEFIVNHVPTPYPARNYTVVAMAPGYKLQVFDQVPVLPGAVMALECRFALKRGSGVGLVFSKNQPGAPYDYSHERRFRIPTARGKSGSRAFGGSRIFATREGLVGRTTANGHVVRRNDRFVALPSRRVLSSNGGNEFQVRLTYRNRSVAVPVWDIGPWNIRDDHWNPSARREQWRDLPQGTPQAQAAFLEDYNGGRDGFGRKVTNPAGIDLADGVFSEALRMRDNDWISVEYLWSPEAGPVTTERRQPAPQREPASTRFPLPERSGNILADILTVARVILNR